MPIATLFDICIHRTALLLQDCYWPVESYLYGSDDEHNPFALLPSHINEELVSAVIQVTPSGFLNVKHLYLVLSSGRIRNFRLENVLLSSEEFVAILAALSVHALNLLKLVLRKIYCMDTPNEKSGAMKSTAIECLLSLSPNLEHLEIDKSFDLKVLQKISSLKHLELDFAPKNKLFDVIPKLDDYYFIPNDTLTYISIFEGCHDHISSEEIAFLLQYCPKLIHITNSIAGALEFLHSEELFCGVLDKQYELQKYTLGDAFKDPHEGVASVSVIHIATVTCPKTKLLDVLVNNHQAVSALSDFKNLESLLIQWENPEPGDFRLGLCSALRRIGSQITDLSIINFSHVDFQSIGNYCPELTALKVEYDTEAEVDESTQALFTNLETLHLQCESTLGVKGEVLQLILSDCKHLTSLYLDNVRCLTDEFLIILFKSNSLPKLKEASFTYCDLSVDGLQMLVSNCSLLEFLCFHSCVLNFDDAVEVVHAINPHVILSSRL